MKPHRVPADRLRRVRHPQTTVRWRLTLLYGGLFFACGAVLLAVTYALVAHAAITHHGPNFLTAPPRVQAFLRSSLGRGELHIVSSQQRIADLHQLMLYSAIALAVMAIISGGLGWIVAGRVLGPLRTIVASTRQISDANLHHRLDIGGPRDELTELADTIDDLLERLQSAFDAQRRFVANASHELRTPLTTMRAMLDVAIGKAHVPAQLQLLDGRLRGQLDHADRLLESFLALARAQHGQPEEQSMVSLTAIADEAIAAVGEAIAAREIELHTALARVSVSGSETLLARMIENLIDNAVRHSPAHGLINVTCRLDDHLARLVIENSGPVLDQGAVAQLGRPFRRLAAERTGSHTGHGLGLSIVAAVAAAHGGTLELLARSEGGFRAEIVLPGAALTEAVAVPA